MTGPTPGDRRLRELERRAATGEVEASAELLIARHRLNRLPEERLRLAAHLEDPAAAIAAREILGVAPRKKGLAAWVRRIGTPDLGTWGQELPWISLVQPVCLRTALAAVDLALPAWSSRDWKEGSDSSDTEVALLLQVLVDVRAWLAKPSPSAAERVVENTMRTSWSGITAEVASELVSIVCPPNLSSRRNRERETARSAAIVAEAAARTLEWAGGEKRANETSLRDAIRALTIPWLLAST